MSNPQHTHPEAQPDPRRWKALALLCAAFFMVILDSAIVVVALPSIDADLAFSAGDLQWVLSAYLLSFGGLLLLGGRVSDLLGRRRMFMLGTGLFALASLGAGLAAGPAAGLELLEPLLGDPALERYQPLYAAHAELLSRAGDAEGAARAYQQAIALTANAVERTELERRLGALH